MGYTWIAMRSQRLQQVTHVESDGDEVAAAARRACLLVAGRLGKIHDQPGHSRRRLTGHTLSLNPPRKWW